MQVGHCIFTKCIVHGTPSLVPTLDPIPPILGELA